MGPEPSITANKIDESLGTPTIDNLQKALMKALERPIYRGLNATIPDNVLRIIVAPKE